MNYSSENDLEAVDHFGQWPIRIGHLFSNTPISDLESEKVDQALFRMEQDFRIRVIKLIIA